MFFCDNPVCRCHVEVPDPVSNRLRYREDNGSTVETSRFKVVIPEFKKELYFCSICINVVSLINKK